VPDPRGVGLASIYLRNLVYHANNLAGRPVDCKLLMPRHHMDGRLFQTLYSRVKREGGLDSCYQQWPHLRTEIKRIKALLSDCTIMFCDEATSQQMTC
jgi:hypothetical protein